jgi:hypothetical protein
MMTVWIMAKKLGQEQIRRIRVRVDLGLVGLVDQEGLEELELVGLILVDQAGLELVDQGLEEPVDQELIRMILMMTVC